MLIKISALAIVAIPHEFAHGIFARLNNLRVKSSGFALFGPILAAFVEPDEKDKVLMEFQELMMAQQFISQGGMDYAREVLEKALGTQKAVDIINRLTSSLQVRPFDFIRRSDPQHLLNFIVSWILKSR